MQNFSENESSADNQQGRLAKQKIELMNFGWYIAGFVEGEGSFNISLRKNKSYKLGWQPILSFNVSQKEKTVLQLMKQTFNCGIIKQRRDGLYSYDVTNPQKIQQNIIPFFNHFIFYSMNKKKNFKLFRQATNLMINKMHTNKLGLKKLLLIREQINQGKGRTRKYSINDVLQEPSETTRQTTNFHL
jgi:hypothetical protein